MRISESIALPLSCTFTYFFFSDIAFLRTEHCISQYIAYVTTLCLPDWLLYHAIDARSLKFLGNQRLLHIAPSTGDLSLLLVKVL